MGITNYFVLCCALFLISLQSSAQSCGPIKKGLTKGKTYTAECDSMIVLDKKTYEGFYNKIFYYEAIIDNQDRLDSLMRAESKAKDVLIKNLDEKISIQAEAINQYRSKIDTLYSISNKSLELNEKAVNALEKEKKKNKFARKGILAAGGVCLFLFGLVIGSAF